MCTANIGLAWLCVILLAAPVLFGQTPGAAKSEDQELAARLQSLKKICISPFAGDTVIGEVAREIAFSALFSAKRFRISEKCEAADAVLKGAVLERSEIRVRGESEGAEFGKVLGGASVSGSSGTAGIGGVRGGSGEALYSSENRSQATVTLRLVDAAGEVLWAYTQESAQGKTKSAVADAVDRAIKQLLKDIERAGRAEGQ